MDMERFVRRQNINHYRHLLNTVTDQSQRNTILNLLDEEQRKQKYAGDSEVIVSF